ncbi:helix-turn-helix transcriptional regulator [Streptomyces sp. WMMC500]|uniref:helix-turn-helix transcriptional regulator n=1 Tax=Streptomyces sp. WMMC500 TaxID=3015154 RepID=UPI00248C4EDF|nr:helix-turn-helix transcriptional regulator [Streptomyces sp. WMMC500]WBB58610.1 helix-turn-helix transcriptional regulator [Streptomyces sp. WMMC500]
MDKTTHGRSPLGEFLSTRRARLKPADVGLPDYGDRRRVPGLRRAELAQLAGVSEAYYIRLEQGLSLNASPQVLDALATALRLDDAERRHLHTLSGEPRKRRRRLPAERVTPAVRQLVAAFGDSPVVVVGRYSDVLMWNRAGHALIAGHLAPDSPDHAATRPNTARLIFLDAHTKDLYADWPRKARDVVGKLRQAVGEFPDDPHLASLIGELTMRSPQFATLWAEHRVRAWGMTEYRMRHPVVGEMDVLQHSLPVPHEQGIRVVVTTAAPDSASQAALHLLNQSTGPTTDEPATARTPM